MAHSLRDLMEKSVMSAASLSNDKGIVVEELGTKTVVCETHGEYISTGKKYYGKREIWLHCEKCLEESDQRVAKEKAEKEATQRKIAMEHALDASCVPLRFVGRSFDNFISSTDEQRKAVEIAREYAENFQDHYKKGTGLVLSGQPGTGKSHLAIAILQALMPAHIGLYTTCMSIIRNIRGTWRRDSEKSETEMLNAYCCSDLLVIDEIGVQYGTDGEQTILFDVLDRRYREMYPTILLTNQDKQGFKQFIGERSFDRLIETSRWVAFDWKSYRATARKESQ